MPNPSPVPYTKAKHRIDCPCPACKGRRGEHKTWKGFRFQKETIELLASASEKTGKSQNEIVETAINSYLKEGEN